MEDLVVQNILESMTDCLLVIGRQGEILYANKATHDILGCDLEALRADGLGVTFFTEEANYEFNQLFVDAIKDKSIRRYSEVSYHNPDGSVKRLAATMSYLVDARRPEDSFIGFMAIFKDITEVFELRLREKRLEEQRQRLVKEKVNSLQKLAAGVAHEIRNPTVTIGGFAARLLKLEGVSGEVQAYASKILDGARRLESIVEEVQNYCDIVKATFVEHDLQQIVRKTILELAPLANEKNVTISFDNETSQYVSCYCDPGMLYTALVHLLSNAIDFTPPASLVSVHLTATSEEVSIAVVDSGDGIKPEDMEFIGNPFFSTRPDRSGMGLATVQRIVNEHMGTFQVNSKRGKGTCATIVVPRTTVK